MRFFRLMAIMVLLLACVVLGAACAGAKGEQGEKGADGVGIQSIANNTDGTLTIYLTNGQSYTTGNLGGSQGEKGDTGAAGAKGDTGDQGLQGIQGPPGPNMIVAMGNINSNGTILQGFNVTSVTWTGHSYDIALTGITYSSNDYVTLVTMVQSGARTYYTSYASGHLFLNIYNNLGESVQERFHFVVLDPDLA
jgi:hypothetical protein